MAADRLIGVLLIHLTPANFARFPKPTQETATFTLKKQLFTNEMCLTQDLKMRDQ